MGLQIVSREQAFRLKRLGMDEVEYDERGYVLIYSDDNMRMATCVSTCSYISPSNREKWVGLCSNYLYCSSPCKDTAATAPTVASALRWIRKNKKIPFGITFIGAGKNIYFFPSFKEQTRIQSEEFETWEEAEFELLNDLLTELE